MEDLVKDYWALFIGLFALGHLLFELWKERISRNWPTTSATQQEIPPKSRFARSGNKRRWKSKGETDCAIAYEVNGREYVSRIDEVGIFTTGGTAVSRTTGLPPSFDVRYQPENPENVYYRHAYSPTTKKTLILVESVIGIVAIGYFFYTKLMGS